MVVSISGLFFHLSIKGRSLHVNKSGGYASPIPSSFEMGSIPIK